MNYEKNVQKRKAKINELEVEGRRLNRQAATGDMPDSLALAIAKNEVQLGAARAALKQAEADLKAEKDRLSSKEYQDAVKKVGDLEKLANKEREAIFDKAVNLLSDIEAWKELTRDHRKIANDHRIEARDLYRAELGVVGRMGELEQSLTKWRKGLRFLDRINNPDLMAAKPANPKKMIPVGERKKMLKERYPEAK